MEAPWPGSQGPTEGRRANPMRIEIVARQQKRAISGKFEILSDEPAERGGEDSAPSPLTYFTASIAF